MNRTPTKGTSVGAQFIAPDSGQISDMTESTRFSHSSGRMVVTQVNNLIFARATSDCDTIFFPPSPARKSTALKTAMIIPALDTPNPSPSVFSTVPRLAFSMWVPATLPKAASEASQHCFIALHSCVSGHRLSTAQSSQS